CSGECGPSVCGPSPRALAGADVPRGDPAGSWLTSGGPVGSGVSLGGAGSGGSPGSIASPREVAAVTCALPIGSPRGRALRPSLYLPWQRSSTGRQLQKEQFYTTRAKRSSGLRIT